MAHRIVLVAAYLLGDDATIVKDRNFQLLLIAGSTSPLGMSMISPLLESLVSPFGTSGTAIGLMITALAAPGIVMVPLLGYLTDQYGRKPILVASLLTFSLAGTAIAFTTDFRIVLGLRMIQGVGFAGITPVLVTSIADLFPGDEGVTAQGLRFSLASIGATLFPFVSGLLVLVAWQYPFFLYLIPAPIAIFILFYFDEDVDRSDDEGEEQPGDETMAATTPGAGKGDDKVEYVTNVIKLVVQPRVTAILVAFFVPIFLFATFLTYNSLIVVNLLDGTPKDAGFLVAVLSVTNASIATQAGRITGIIDSRFTLLVFANVSMAAGLALVVFSPVLYTAYLGVLLMGTGIGLTLSMYRDIITGFAPLEYRGGLVSVSESMSRVATSAAPIVVGIVIGSMTPVFGSGAALKWIIFTVGILGGGLGIVCLYVARTASSVTVH